MSKSAEYFIENSLKDCAECDGLGVFPTLSECCFAKRDPDTGLCYECKDHSDPAVCEECNSTGIVPYDDEDALNDKENENIANNDMMKDPV